MAERDSVVEWLLEPDNPPVRYLTLTRLAGRPVSDPEVLKAKSRLADYPPTQAILSRLDEFLEDDDGAYEKYTGKYWQLIFLGQFLAPSEDPRVRRLVEDVLAKPKWVSSSGGQCLTANIIAAATRLGFGEHPVVLEQREALARRVVSDGGIDCTAMSYSLLPRCQMAQPKVLLCLSQVEPGGRSKAIQSAIKSLTTNLLANEVFVYVPGNRNQWLKVLERQPKASELPPGLTAKENISRRRDSFLEKNGPGERQPKAGWLKFGFPLHYNSDVLEATYALAQAGAAPSRQLDSAVDAILSKRTKEGTWVMENSLNGKMLADVEVKGKPSKWLTWCARFTLRHFNQ